MTIYKWASEISRGPPTQNMTLWTVIFETNELDDDDKWPPDNILHLIEWLNSHLEKIPEQHRKSATIDFNSKMEYDDPSIQLRISYCRPETDEEFAVRYKNYETALDEKAEHDGQKSTYYPHWDYKGNLHNHDPDMKDKKCDNCDWEG